MKSRITLLVLCAIAAVVLIGLGLMRGNLFKVKNIEISAEDISEDDMQHIIEASGISIGQSIFDINQDNVITAINSTGEYYTEEILLVYPSTVKIIVKRRIPAAIIEYEGGLMLIDEAANAIKLISSGSTYDLPRFTGVRISLYQIGGAIETKNSYQKSIILTVMQSFNEYGTADLINVISLEDLSNMYLLTVNGKRIDLCEAVDVEKKLAWLAEKDLQNAIFDDEEHVITLYSDYFVIK